MANISIYPNPVKDKLTINFGSEGSRTVQVFDIRGQLVRQIQCNGAALIVDTGNMPAGIYIVRSNGATARFVKK